MESPFFRSHWNYPRHPRYVPSSMQIPVQRRTTPVGSKVVLVPVHFVGSEKSRSDLATKIQKVFRGFLVRKSVKKVMAIRREVDGVEEKLANGETVDLIRNDAKERLKVGETLMTLLFRLDSVKGVDSGVRDLRKAVIKKAIALQEKVDSIVACDEAMGIDEALEVGNSECGSEAVDGSLEMNASGARESGVEKTLEAKDRIPKHESESSAAHIDYSCDPLEAQPDTCDGNKRAIGSADDCNELENDDSSSELKVSPEVPAADNDMNSPCEITEKDEFPEDETVAEPKVPEEVDDNDMVHRATEWAEGNAEMSEAESQTDSSANPASLVGVVENEDVEEREGGGNEEDCVEEEDSRLKGREDDKQSRELLERMIVDNKKMMEMMAQLFERNEMQTRLLSSLSQRVEQLEKAFVCETLRRKKKRNGCTVDGSVTCPKTNKCGQ